MAAASCRSQERQHGSFDVVVGVGKSSWLSRGVRVPLDRLLLSTEEVVGSSPGIVACRLVDFVVCFHRWVQRRLLVLSTICVPPPQCWPSCKLPVRSVRSRFCWRSGNVARYTPSRHHHQEWQMENPVHGIHSADPPNPCFCFERGQAARQESVPVYIARSLSAPPFSPCRV